MADQERKAREAKKKQEEQVKKEAERERSIDNIYRGAGEAVFGWTKVLTRSEVSNLEEKGYIPMVNPIKEIDIPNNRVKIGEKWVNIDDIKFDMYYVEGFPRVTIENLIDSLNQPLAKQIANQWHQKILDEGNKLNTAVLSLDRLKRSGQTDVNLEREIKIHLLNILKVRDEYDLKGLDEIKRRVGPVAQK